MNILVCYDVNTQTKPGERRLRQVARVCLGFGQRVQDSVFECRVTDTQEERFRQRLLKVIDQNEDSLRIYRLPGNRDSWIQVFGIDYYRDPDAPMVV